MGRVRCLFMGVNYVGTPHELRGCVNDAENLRDAVVAAGVADLADVVVLREPTAREIVDALRACARESYAGAFDTLFVSFSGHGTWIRDSSGDEVDGRDECICPADCDSVGVLRDDELGRMFAQVSPAVKVRVIMDCCHSGTTLDLPYAYAGFARPLAATRVGDAPTHPDVMTLSGCRDDQTSADAYDRARGEFTGALTSAFVDAMDGDATLGNDALATLAVVRALLRERRMPQVPQLASSRPRDDPADREFVRLA